MLRYSFLAFAILAAMSVEAPAQGVLTAGVYTRSAPKSAGAKLAAWGKLTVTDVPTGNSVVHFARNGHELPICFRSEDQTVTFDLPKSYAMNSPIIGSGTCTVVESSPGCGNTCSVPAQTWRFKQTDPRTIVVTDEGGSRYKYKRSGGDAGK